MQRGDQARYVFYRLKVLLVDLLDKVSDRRALLSYFAQVNAQSERKEERAESVFEGVRKSDASLTRVLEERSERASSSKFDILLNTLKNE